MKVVTCFIILLTVHLDMGVSERPNIVIIIADDLGWNDVGFHSGDVDTPNIDALAYHGIILNRHYGLPVCSPSRTALMTGDYPLRHGMQGSPCSAGSHDGLPLDVKIMPQYFSKLGYKSHLVGKWHLGYESPRHLPTRRGFDSFFGYLNGFLGYWDYTHHSKEKTSLHEGGVRTVAAVWSPLIEKQSRVSEQYFHISDWLPTLFAAADRNPKLKEINSDAYYGESGRWMRYDPKKLNSTIMVHTVGPVPKNYRLLRQSASLDRPCTDEAAAVAEDCHTGYCLFDILNDPAECYNLAPNNSQIVADLKAIIDSYRPRLVPTPSKFFDSRASPKRYQVRYNIRKSLSPRHSSSQPNRMYLCFELILLLQFVARLRSERPNIVIIIADDLGWNDVGFHGGDMDTPNIDALAYNGVILTRHYSQPVCSPSRTALLTGDYPFRNGMQGRACVAGIPDGLRTGVKLMPEYFSTLGYTSHLIGKWHIGFQTPNHLPTRRGFNTFFGYLNGFLGYWDGTHYDGGNAGRDIRRNEEGAWRTTYGKYLTKLLTEEAINIIDDHEGTEGLLMIVAEAAAHATNLNVEREAPSDVKNTTKRGYLRATVRELDWSVGQIVSALEKKQILNNTIIIFIADNGAPSVSPTFCNSGSNWPLRGEKLSIHEGGVRTIAAAWSPLFEETSRVSDQLFHITDWLPTLYAAAGGDPKELEIHDGINQWPFLAQSKPGTRDTIVVDIDDVSDCEAIIKGNWKLVKNHAISNEKKFSDNYYGEDGRWMSYNDTNLKNSIVAKVLGGVPKNYRQLRDTSTIFSVCPDEGVSVGEDCHNNYCLYDVYQDPTECYNMAQNHTDIVENLKAILDDYRKYLVPNTAKKYDPNSDPKYWNDYWSPWLNETSDN
ncbi:arylsulfatase B [Halyomorpha halys]|uniref:arylsulfatase B n=1 Tax=Halyomorpha halys TaxID=286706 RepID=UPI0034D2AD55